METVYEHPFMTTWFIFWFFFCLDAAKIKFQKVN
jgi:hypothetical protein